MTQQTFFSFAELQASVRALGARFDENVLKATRDLYRPFVAAASKDSVQLVADLSYGSDPRQKLDIYSPGQDAAPVVVYVPGGGFVSGDKAGDPHFYANLGHYLAAAGHVVVTINYRLAPANTWPAGAEDLRGAVDWVRRMIARFGGDPSRICLFGQSAGAAHTATYLFDPAFAPHAREAVHAGMLFSGVYDLTLTTLSPGAHSYYGSDESALEQRSPALHLDNNRLPLLLGTAEFDPPVIGQQAFELARRLTRRDGRSPEFAWLAGHNHVSTVHSLGSGQDDVGSLLRGFLNRNLKAQ